MTKDRMDLVWKLLPWIVREEIKIRYRVANDAIKDPRHDAHLYSKYRKELLEELFGSHNIEATLEPPEALHVRRKGIQDLYISYMLEKESATNQVDKISLGARMAMLEELFGREKCLPDKPKLKQETINNTSDMEKKELDLSQLLRGYEDKDFYSPAFGKAMLKRVLTVEEDSKPLYWDCRLMVYTYPDGRIYKDAEPIMWPSRELYEKYPLDVYAAWEEWKSEQESQKP